QQAATDAQRLDYRNPGGPVMQSTQMFDDNPCRPLHFKPPPPCAPVVTDDPTNALIETSRTRLLATAALFAVVFLVVALRLVEVGALSGGAAESQAGGVKRAQPPAAVTARADIVDRNGKLLATTLDTPSLYADPRQIFDAGEATRAVSAVLPGLDPKEVYGK